MQGVVKTTCPYCGVGCGVEVTFDGLHPVSIKGDKSHPANLGRICSKGAALLDTIDYEGRLLHPTINGEKARWEEALDLVANQFQKTIDLHGPDSVAFYVSGQLLTEDYYVANKLMKGFIGSANIDTNSRLCMSSSVAGHKRAYGADAMPGCYEDLELANLVILVGSNLAWCHPVLYQRVAAAKAIRPELKVIVIDPRRTASCEVADLHLAIKSGSDGYLFSGLFCWLHQQQLTNHSYVEQHCDGFEAAMSAAQQDCFSVEAVALHCGLTADQVELFYAWFADNEKTVSVYSQGINQSSSGTDKVNAIINCHLLLGRIGQPGMGPFSVTGQPNAMGGREVGALSNQLAAHMDFDQADLVGRFWNAPDIARSPGLKAVDLFEAVEQGKIRALWIMATNPAMSMPNASQVQSALSNCEFLVVSDCMTDTDTTRYADVKLPALAWGEKDGTVTNSERRISRQRTFLDYPGEARPDWKIICDVAKRMGYHGFNFNSAQAIFTEHASLSKFENNLSRGFDLGGLSELTPDEYNNLSPIQWPVTCQTQATSARLFNDGQFYTSNTKANFIALHPRLPVNPVNNDYPLVLNTGRIRDQWHSMTRSGKSDRLNSHDSEPLIEINPTDAVSLDIKSGELVQIESRWGEVLMRASLSDSIALGSLFSPMHWNDQFASNANIDRVTNPETDPISGQPEFKHTPVRIKKYSAGWYGFLLSRGPVDTADFPYWVKSRREALWHYELSGIEQPKNWAALSSRLLNCGKNGDAKIDYSDLQRSTYRAAKFHEDRLESCLFVGPGHELPPRDQIMALFMTPFADDQKRWQALSGKSPASNGESAGKVICACFNVGINTLSRKIKDQNLTTPEQIGNILQAGTNCGSCIPELLAIIDGVQNKNY